MQINPYSPHYPLPATSAPDHRPDRYRPVPAVQESEPVLQGELIRGPLGPDPVRDTAQRFRAAAGAPATSGGWSAKALERYATVEQGTGRTGTATGAGIDYYV